LRKDVEGIDDVVRSVIFHRRSRAREVLAGLCIEIILVIKATDELATLPRKLRNVEGEHLILGFGDGNAIKLVKEG
jgi:hypothetical protein